MLFTIPKEKKYVDNEVFETFKLLTHICVELGNQAYISVDGVLIYGPVYTRVMDGTEYTVYNLMKYPEEQAAANLLCSAGRNAHLRICFRKSTASKKGRPA